MRTLPRRRGAAARLGLAALALVVAVPALAACSSGSGEPDIAGAAAQQRGRPEPVPGFDGTAIHVGVLAPATGPGAEVAAARLAGLQAELDRVTFELGGVDGTYPIDLVGRDSSTPANARTGYADLLGSTVALVDVEGAGVVDALLPSLRSDRVLAVPGAPSSAWTREPQLLPVGRPHELAAADALGWLVDPGGGNADPARVCRVSQAGIDDGAWQAGLDLAAPRAGLALLAAVEVPAAPPASKGVQPQIDQLVAAGCTSVVAATGLTALVELLRAAAASGFDARWVAPAWSATAVLADDDAELRAFAAEHLAVVDSGPATSGAPGQTDLLRIRDGYAPQQPPSGAFLAGVLQARALVAVLTAAVREADLSHAGVLAAAARVRTLRLHGIAPDQVLGAPERRTAQDRVTVLRPRADAPTVLEPLVHGYAAPFAGDVERELLG